MRPLSLGAQTKKILITSLDLFGTVLIFSNRDRYEKGFPIPVFSLISHFSIQFSDSENKKNMICTGTLSSLKVCSHIFMISDVKLN